MKSEGNLWKGRTTLVTGHTGFKGGWLALWLHRLGARVHGYALDPPTVPSFFEAAQVSSVLSSDTRADVTNACKVQETFRRVEPEFVFHLAAQPLVRESYRNPVQTLLTNVMGTAHVLEASRASCSVRAIVVATTDKVYENREWIYPYRELDRLGGLDPYSASKAAAELIAASYRASFFDTSVHRSVHLSTARAGNVIGGGDWSADRLIPDCLHAFQKEVPVRLRFPDAVRPWQHVLEPLSGYLTLAEHLVLSDGHRFARPWNFGPDTNGDATVGEIAKMAAGLWGRGAIVEYAPSAHELHEAGVLKLDSTGARSMLQWRSRWTLRQALEHTIAWHRAWKRRMDMRELSMNQIAEYEAASL